MSDPSGTTRFRTGRERAGRVGGGDVVQGNRGTCRKNQDFSTPSWPGDRRLDYRRIYPFTIVTILYMTALTKRIPVSEPVWKDLAELRRAGQTYDDILMEMIELQKKQRLEEDIRQSLEEGDFIPLSGIKAHKNKRIATGERTGIKNPRNKRQGLPA